MDCGEPINGLYINPLKTACFTGHRPEKIPFDTGFKLFREVLTSIIYLHSYEAVARGYDTFLCGMQRGVDTWAGQQILRLKEVYPHVRLICVSPFRKEIDQRSGADRSDYIELRDRCDEFIVLHDRYAQGCYQERNRFMVERSSLIIGAVADRKSGTGQTLNFARRKGLTVEEIDLVTLAEEYQLYR